MRIQHNIMAMNAYRNYNTNNKALSGNLEKLSSGYKINRAGDDAAGLAISEKMRAQITGLNAAQKNVKDGISLVKTAEGAMQEIQDMLNRMDYLATQSANGTYDNEVDRLNLQKEVDALKTEINRIADSANFNGIKLLDGSLDSSVESTTTDYVSGKNNIPILQNVATNPTEEVGKATVLHEDGSSTAKKTSFNLELHNINLTGEHGDEVEITIGGNTMTLTFDKNASSSTPAAGKLAVGNVSADQLAAAIKATWDAGVKQIGGQEFTATTTSGGLKFEQTADPTNSKELVEPCKVVDIKFTPNSTEGKYTWALTATEKEALAGSQKIVIDDKEYDISVATSAATGVSANCGDYKVQYDNGKLTITNLTGTSAPQSVKIGATQSSDATSANPADGTTANAASVNVSSFVASTAGCDKVEVTFYQGDQNNVVAGTLTVDMTGSSDVYKEVNINGVSYGVTVGQGAAGITITALDQTAGTKGNQEIVCKVVASTGGAASVTDVKKVTIAGGRDEKGANVDYSFNGVGNGKTVEFNGVKFTVENSVEDAVKEMADFINSNAEFKDLYKATANGTTLNIEFLTEADKSKVGSMAVVKKDGVEETDLGAGTAVPSKSSAEGTWNVKTTENKTGAVSGSGVLASTTFKLNSGIVKDNNTLTIGNKTYTFKVGKDSSATGQNIIDLSKYEEGDTENLIKEAALLLSQDGSNDAFTIGHDEEKPGEISIHEKQGQTVYTNGELSDLAKFDELVYFNSAEDESVTETTVAKGKALTLQIGDTSDKFNQMQVSIGDMHTNAMGTGKTTLDGEEVEVTKTIADVDISSQEGAQEAVAVIKNAINYVSGIRGDLGAIQNRLDHTANNLSVMAENIQDAESTIRDTDVAEEMMSYVKNNILVQSAQAMLAQANQVPQGVLQLLG